MQIKQQQSIVGLLICDTSRVKPPDVVVDVRHAISEKRDWGQRLRKMKEQHRGTRINVTLILVQIILLCLALVFVCV